ncbi:hypothetical protein CES85_3645 (plasmid) [Ochrobactrum quorumnocens]|uniref:Uncharacterized protein n=1 Tax=Ochrobactrum quorumnocens TaxID=271865 RepID=A0A248UNY2_9HYPH|nr:hypothetical protein CES85_3645 [[Ochrobactrum] quorumnocens]
MALSYGSDRWHRRRGKSDRMLAFEDGYHHKLQAAQAYKQ